MDPPPLLHHQYTRAGFRRSDSRLETPPGNTRVAHGQLIKIRLSGRLRRENHSNGGAI